MDSGSPSRKHPRSDAFASVAASLAPPNKRRRTTFLCNPVPQNLLNGVSPFAKYNRNVGSQTPAGTSSVSGLASAKQSDTHSVTSSTGRSRLAEQIRSFAPKPLMSPFAARAALKNKSFGASTLRRTTSAAGPSVRGPNGSYSRPSSRAGSVASAVSPPAPRPVSVIGGGLFTPAKPVATPARRIHHPDFSFDNKPPPSSFRFTAGDSRANTPTAQSSGITSRAHTPVRRGPTMGSPSVSFSSRVSPAARRTSPAESKARADSILGFFSSSLDKARQALAGNRADRLEEKRQKEKEAIRKQMEEDERIRRIEIFERELEREERELQEEMERIEDRKRMKEQEEIERRQEREERAAEAQFISSVKHRSQEVQLSFSGANGGPSFVTEDTIPDTIYTDYNTQGSHYGVTSTFRDGHLAQYSSQELHSRPSVSLGVTINNNPDKLPQPPQLQRDLALRMEGERDREEGGAWEPEARAPQQPQNNVISLDSDDGDDNNGDSEQETLRKPSFLFSHMPTREDAPSDGGSSQELDEDEYYENEEYERDDSRNYEEGEEGEYGEEEFEEDAEAEEEYEEGEEVSTMPRRFAVEDDEIEEVIEEFGSEPAEDSDGAETDQYDAKAEGEYEEEETEKDDTDTERIVEWKIPRVGKGEDPDRSLGSTVLLPSQPTSFTNKGPVSPGDVPSDPERTPVPEDRSCPEAPREPGPVQSTLGNSFFGAQQPTEAQPIPVKVEANLSAPTSLVSENDVRSGSEELQVAEMSDSGRQPSSPNSIIVIGRSVNGDPEDSEAYSQREETQEPIDLGITVKREDVYNKNKRHIGTIDEQGYIYANTDEQAIGFMDQWGQFFTVGHEGEGARDLSDNELNGMPSEDELEYEAVSGNDEAAEEAIKEVGRDLKDVPGGVHDQGRVSSESVGSEEELIEPSAEKVTCSDDEQEDDAEVLVEEEKQVGLEIGNQCERMASSPGETAFPPAKEGVDRLIGFRHDQEEPSQTPNSNRFLSNKDISKNLALTAGGALFVKPPAREECIVDDTIEDEPEIPVDPDLEMQQALTPASDDGNSSPMAVDEEPKERGESPDTAKDPKSNDEGKGPGVTEELDELPEASDLVIVEDGEDEESGDDRPALYPMLPDSVCDRSSIAREFTREATVETVEWDGSTDALYEGVRIALEGVEGSGESSGEPSQSEEPVESDEEIELVEDLDEIEEVEVEVEVEGVGEKGVGEVVDAEFDSGELESGREKQSAEESAQEGELGPVEEGAGVVEQTEEADSDGGAKSATSGIDLAGQVETEEFQAEELEAGVQADIEDTIDSEVDIPDNISEEPVALVGLGHRYNDNTNSAHEPQEKQRNQTSGIEVIVEIDHARQITPVSENAATTPPQLEATPPKRRRADPKPNYPHPDSPLSGDSPVQQKSGSVGDDIQNQDAGEAPAPTKRKRIRKHRRRRRRKSGIDPLYVPSPQELEQDAEDETDSEIDQPAAKRRKYKAKSVTTTPAKPIRLDEELESGSKVVGTVAAATEVASIGEKREWKVKLGERGVVPMFTSEETSIPLGKALRDGKVVQPPPLIVTPPKRAKRGQSAEPKVFSRENSEEPEVRALRNRNVVVNRGRSVSVEPSAGESDTGRAPKRIKRGPSTQPTVPSRGSSEEPEVRALRNRTVVVNRGRSASVELSASETDTAGGGSRRKTRSAKTAVPEAPSTPKKKGKKAAELPLSSIKEVVAEESPKKNARAARKK
ncbi:unnamed protein product [Tuber aestivum]|uniref:Uncharacterized protein n=1 Tax=Tuber aestivum TaxID=59557 RepID=A0A292Q403_9PEZI|nr:unnamed protein product [Tuber aestivum]